MWYPVSICHITITSWVRTTEFLSAMSAFFHSGLAIHLDTGRCCGLINLTDLKHFHLFLGNNNFGDSCLFIDFTCFNTWSFPGDLFWRYSNVQLWFQILLSLPDSKLEITLKSSPLPLLQWSDYASVCPVCAAMVCFFLMMNCLCIYILLSSFKMFDLRLILQPISVKKSSKFKCKSKFSLYLMLDGFPFPAHFSLHFYTGWVTAQRRYVCE